jgi:Fe-S cluster biosynthesis and repair protein YggX
MARTVQCVYLKKEAEGSTSRRIPGELGKKIYNSSARKPGSCG